MKLEYGSKSQEYDASGTASATKVTLVNTDGANVPIFLPTDKIGLSNTKLLELALEVLYQENFPNRAENDKFNQVDEQLQKNKETAMAAEQAAATNKEYLDTVSAITEVLIALAVTQNGGMQAQTYAKVAAFVKPLVNDKRYINGDIISAPYPFDTNPKWPKGTATILRFTMPQDDGYIYKGQKIEDMLQKGALSIVLPKLN
ncbi:TPA: DUF1366 domain-containing protein [Streptococcus pyogenes]|nr:DUF1366 domain-containing protein [Streptococcus pyogenes]HEP5229931.1 DUF1366 domain-containing protein [Streptococcus pyogenes]HES3505103.1 DUF1366 domain-containing protein [Streptococcus pyogenes]HES4619099.1 DUF1366 domain-containing protein [Streptococcus pyogenes]